MWVSPVFCAVKSLFNSAANYDAFPGGCPVYWLWEVSKTVIYLDTVLFYNILADDLLLLAAGRLSGLPLRRGRIFLAAVLGGVYAAAAVLETSLLRAWWLKLVTAALMVWIAFGRKPLFLRRYLLFLLVSGAFAGIEMAICGFTGSVGGTPPFSMLVFLGSFVFCWLLLGVVFRGSAVPLVRGNLTPLAIARGDRQIRVTALLDSGCSIRDPVRGFPVAVVELSALSELFSPQERLALERQKLLESVPCTQLPFLSVGGSGVLTAFQADSVTVDGNTYSDALVAIHPGSLGGETFHALWGGKEREI